MDSWNNIDRNPMEAYEVVDWVEEGAFFYVPVPRALGLASLEEEMAAAADVLAAIRDERPELAMIEFRAPFDTEAYNILPPEVWEERYVIMFIPPVFMPPIPDYPVIYGFDANGSP
ncbi:hypothetical protein PR048_026033 [Dryococelus australis]|uniref:Uncharacterized protein n=1 Tax=Dryococelus australis TaxID=614101 RepID=A0ABQ9GK97_9NEOP|nr:hypothetical protein PR048_026033 [Dryococelus australis]